MGFRDKRFRKHSAKALSIMLLLLLVSACTTTSAANNSVKGSTPPSSLASMETSHASYLDLTTNIADLRSRITEWQKGDASSLNVAGEKLDRVKVVLSAAPWPEVMVGAIDKTRAALDPMDKALAAKDQAAAEAASKTFGDASHDVIHAHYGDWLPAFGSASFTAMAPHVVYLDLSANIADLRSRVTQWEKGDEASLNIAKEKAERIGVLTKHMAPTKVLVKPVGAIGKGLTGVVAALEAKDAAAAQAALKPISDASHDLTHDFYAWMDISAGASDSACIRASYLDLSANIADLRSRVTQWEKGDEASLNIAKEKLERIEVVLGHAAWPTALSESIVKAESALGPIGQVLEAKDVAAAQAAIKPLADASHDVTHAYYADWLPIAQEDHSQMAGEHQMSDGSSMGGGHSMSDGSSMGGGSHAGGSTTAPVPPKSSAQHTDSAGAHAAAPDSGQSAAGPNWPVLGIFAAPLLLGTAVAVRRRWTSPLDLPDAVEPPRTNLLDNRLFRKVFESPLYPGVFQYVTVAVFAVIVYQLLFGPSAAHDNFGTAMTWVLWWPLIPLFFVLLGRFWCAICPFATLSDFVQKLVGRERPVPQFLKKYGIWIIDAVFILITWSDHTFGIVESPRGTGVLLIGLILGVVTAGVLWERRTWCRYLCFLGGLSGNYSRSGALELRATPSVCKTCKTQSCFKGSEKAPGCPMFEFPRTMDTNASCNLCGYCVKTCPNGSIRVTPRMPTKELWGIRKPKFEEAFLSCVIMGIVFIQNITMLEVWPGILAWLEGVVGTTSYFVTFTITFAVLMALPVAALLGASRLARGGNRTTLQAFTLFGYALIPLDLAGHLAHNLFHLLAEGKNIAYTALALVGVQSSGSAALVDTLTIQYLQYGLIALGTGASLYTAYRIAKSRSESKSALWSAVVPIAVLMVALGVVNLVLFYLPMEMRM